MKNKTKLLVIILALIMMCVSFTGCAELDQMREQHATWTVAGDTDSITYKGVEYKKLPNLQGETFYNIDGSLPIYVTDSDVPVLLSQYCTSLSISINGNFIVGYVGETSDNVAEYGYIGADVESTYCKAELYDEIVEKSNSDINYTNYAYSYYSEEDFDSFELYYLSAEESDAIDKVVKEVEPVENSNIYETGYFLLNLVEISDDELFSRYSYEIYGDEHGNYYVVDFAQFWNEYTEYKVPKDMNDIFKKLTSHADSMDYYAFSDLNP